MLTADELIAFEANVAKLFVEREIQGYVHLSGGNEEQLLRIFQRVKPQDWVFSNWRAHYHALLKGVPQETVLAEIKKGHSMELCFPEYNMFCSAILCGALPIAVGTAWAIKNRGGDEHVWVFVGDAASHLGPFYECTQYAANHKLPVTFVVEDNGLCVGEPTERPWGATQWPNIIPYRYELPFPHIGATTWVKF